MEKLARFVYKWDYNYSSLLNPLKEDLIDWYYKTKSSNPNIKDINISSSPVTNLVCNKIREEIKKEFFVGDLIGDKGLGLYIQDNKTSTLKLHDHIGELGSIQAVFYLNIPQSGGEILFRYLENSEWGDELILKPKINQIYFFPYWLPHTPLPQEDETPRFCFNFGYESNERPIHKLSGDRW